MRKIKYRCLTLFTATAVRDSLLKCSSNSAKQEVLYSLTMAKSGMANMVEERLQKKSLASWQPFQNILS